MYVYVAICDYCIPLSESLKRGSSNDFCHTILKVLSASGVCADPLQVSSPFTSACTPTPQISSYASGVNCNSYFRRKGQV